MLKAELTIHLAGVGGNPVGERFWTSARHQFAKLPRLTRETAAFGLNMRSQPRTNSFTP